MIRPVVPNQSALLGRSIARERLLDTLILTTLPLIIGGLITICLALAVEGFPQFTTRSLWVVAWLSLANTSVGYLFYNHALRDLTALDLTPIFTAFISWILPGERLGLLQGLGLIVMIVGVIMV